MRVSGEMVRRRVEELAPERLAESWDNVGWQVGHDGVTVSHVLVALDVDVHVLGEARRVGANLIVAHHPLFFRPLRRLDPTTPRGRLLVELVRADVAVYAAHTNLDAVREGVNGALAEALGLEPVAPLQPVEGAPGAWGFGAICESPPMTTLELVQRVHRHLGTPVPRVTPGSRAHHRRVALLGGSGAAFLGAVARSGCTCFITGELKYHDAQHARAWGITVIEAGHYYSEAPVLAKLARWLQPLDIPVTVSREITSPFAPDWHFVEDHREGVE
ncbi:MAG: Nif3-like dinuclear metal center hexameric protein [Ardenticatenia bacterium]|nr:Nif3-like dinuclear metal center hexameric protein [Ardenticatenia bacterium]